MSIFTAICGAIGSGGTPVPPPDDPDVQLVVEGDSLTYGTGSGGPDNPNSYPNQLRALLELETSRGWVCTNYATPGEAMTGAISDELPDMATEWSTNDIKVIWAGANDIGADTGDILDAFTAYFEYLIAQGHPADKLYCLNILLRTDVLDPAAFDTDRLIVNAGLAGALPVGVTVVDVASCPELEDPSDTTYFSGDEVHLNATGNGVVAQKVFEAIQPNL